MAKLDRSRSKRNSKLSYNIQERWLKNKARRIARHLKKHPNDEQSKGAL